jgi:hypothetical protein
MALMATVMIFAILDLSHEKARHAAELQASTALRVFEDSLAGNSDTIRYGQPIGDRHTATIWDGTPFEYSQDAMDRISDVTGARLTFFSYDAGTGAFRRSLTNVRQADGRPAVGTTLGSESPARPALTSGSQYSGYSEVVGLTISDDLRTGPSESGTVTGAIAAAVPQGSLAETAREIIFSLSSWLILSLAVGLSVTVAALWWLLRPWHRRRGSFRRWRARTSRWSCRAVRSEDEVGRVARPWPNCATTSPKAPAWPPRRRNRRPSASGQRSNRCASSMS